MPVKNKKFVLKGVVVTDYAAEGKSLGRIDGKVIFIEGAVPGDVTDVFITKNKKDWAEGKATRFETLSPDRIVPFCKHFGICGGCKWQMLPYDTQLDFKQREVEQTLKRIAKTDLPQIAKIIGSEKTIHYRNKLEFTFSNRRYLTSNEIKEDAPIKQENALGYHVPRLFDKILNIEECFLMDDINNTIRNSIRNFAVQNNYSYYDIKEHSGWLRNIIIRFTGTGQLMINIVIGNENLYEITRLCDFVLEVIPGITTLLYTVNQKWNDSIYDLKPTVYYGPGFITEVIGGLTFKISAKSFFQTNSKQAEQLYQVVSDFASLSGNEIVYDLYCGTGTIGISLASQSGKIIGVDIIPEAIADARENAFLNNIEQAEFYAGDVISLCNKDFFDQHGRPDLIISDPPRAGMHQNLIDKLLQIQAPKIVYVSCNVATQARDILLLSEKYRVEKIQPLDMFPHTHHIECVVLLLLKQ